ncbi:hypothetical protein PHYC_01545 [Phycisphaerales bacterium]|nr:hypothetical protein PHYC_01545 [Phycisphaerales bacterium]
MKILFAALACTFLTGCQSPGLAPGRHHHAVLADGRISFRPVSTYSIVARDAQTGRLGVAVQSHWFSVGSVVPWAQAGVGAVATQSLVDVRYGPMGLALMRGGRSAEESLKALTASDAGEAVRQVAMIDAKGRVATHTGAKCIATAGHVSGTSADGSVYSAQANMMHRPGVPEAMAKAFESAAGDLADRLLAALHAAQDAGGDIRGKQSAAILIVKGEPTPEPWQGRVVEIRVEDAADPLAELSRLVSLNRAYDLMNAGDAAIEKNDIAGALESYGAAQRLAPGNSEMTFWTAVSLANAGKIDEALPLLAKCYADKSGDWRELLNRLPASGLLNTDEGVLRRLLEAK